LSHDQGINNIFDWLILVIDDCRKEIGWNLLCRNLTTVVIKNITKI